MKKVLIVLLTMIFILGAIFGGGYLYYRSVVRNPLTDGGETISVTVPENGTLYSILDQLDKEGKLRNNRIAKFYYKYSGYDLSVRPGKYDVKTTSTLDQLLTELRGKNRDVVKVTIPEGFTVEKIASKIEESKLATKQEFLEAVKSYKLPSYVKENKDRRYQLEGFLFPTTYSFEKNTKATDIVSAMVKEFETTMKMIEVRTDSKIPQDQYDDIANKAAMIERETFVESERPIVASVINNRLDKKMKLQIDATILYAIGVDSKEVTYKDMEIKSPFNTYYVQGLPAGPISNPGFTSLLAAWKPQNTNYIYYLFDPKNNKHYFTDNYNDFLKKKDEFYSKAKSNTNTNTTDTKKP